jgi:YHS domain-containing protein
MGGRVLCLNIRTSKFGVCDFGGDEAMATHTDPVCGMKVDDQKTTLKSTYQDTTYYFCAQGCKTKFDEKPQQFAGKQAGR